MSTGRSGVGKCLCFWRNEVRENARVSFFWDDTPRNIPEEPRPHLHGGCLKSRIAVCATVNFSTCWMNMFSCQILCNSSESIFPLVQCGCVQREWAVPKQRGSPLFCSCVPAWCSLALTETFVTPRPCDSRLISVAPTLIGQLHFYILGRSRVRAHSAPMDSVFLRVHSLLSETQTCLLCRGLYGI